VLRFGQGMAERETFLDGNGVEHTVIKDPRYKLPLVVPTSIYNMLAEMSGSSTRTYKERKEAGAKYYKMLQDAAAREEALSPKERAQMAQEKQARENAEAQQKWDAAVNAAIMKAKMRAAGYDV